MVVVVSYCHRVKKIRTYPNFHRFLKTRSHFFTEMYTYVKKLLWGIKKPAMGLFLAIFWSFLLNFGLFSSPTKILTILFASPKFFYDFLCFILLDYVGLLSWFIKLPKIWSIYWLEVPFSGQKRCDVPVPHVFKKGKFDKFCLKNQNFTFLSGWFKII